MRPGAAPYTALLALFGMAAEEHSTRLPELPSVEPGTQRLLIIDQYEELYTTADAQQRECFEQSLLQLIGARTIFLLPAMRADFYTNLMDSPVWAAVRDHRLEITPPRGDALRDAIALPARDVGVTWTLPWSSGSCQTQVTNRAYSRSSRKPWSCCGRMPNAWR